MSDDINVEEYEEKIESFFDKEVADIISSEVGTLGQISKLCESIEEKIRELYIEKFPKTCAVCGRVYNTRDEFISATQDTPKHGVLFTKEINRVQEYRNCVCGSTLMVMVSDRRDTTAFGVARRELFNLCVQKLQDLTQKEEEEVVEMVRKLFRDIIGSVQAKPKSAS